MAEHADREAAFADATRRREYFRVHTRIAIRTRALEPAEVDRLRLDIGERKPRGEATLDPRLEQWLERIERKLDDIRAHLDPEVERPLGTADLRDIELSGSGLAWRETPVYPAETWVRADFELPGPRPHCVVALARSVERRSGGDTEPPQAIAFEAIAETDRDAIVRHCLDVERRNIQVESGKRS